MADVFQYNPDPEDASAKKCNHSSEIPKIRVDGRLMLRHQFWPKISQNAARDLPETLQGEQPVYIATGGGYGSFNSLIASEQEQGKIAAGVASIKGDLFRDLSVFDLEKEKVKKQITEQIGVEKLAENPAAIEQTLRAFYSDEVNTKIAKEVVKDALRAKKSAIYESASIYPDTLERAQLARENGVKAVLVAGDMDLTAAIAKNGSAEPSATAASYQKFATRFESELVPAFDEVRLYNNDGEKPVLIAEKKAAGQQLEILNPELYQKFLEKKSIDPKSYDSATAEHNVVIREHREPEVYKPKSPELPSQLPPAPSLDQAPGRG